MIFFHLNKKFGILKGKFSKYRCCWPDLTWVRKFWPRSVTRFQSFCYSELCPENIWPNIICSWTGAIQSLTKFRSGLYFCIYSLTGHFRLIRWGHLSLKRYSTWLGFKSRDETVVWSQCRPQTPGQKYKDHYKKNTTKRGPLMPLAKKVLSFNKKSFSVFATLNSRDGPWDAPSSDPQ